MTAIFNRTRDPSKRTESGFVPDSFFRSFGPDTAIVRRDYRGTHVTTFADLGEAKRRRQREILEIRRSVDECVRAAYLWVFFCPGAFGFAFRGWWTYLVGIGYKSDRYTDKWLTQRGRELFPQEGLFADFSTDDSWKEWFARRYQRGLHCRRSQGKAMVWVRFGNGRPIEIIGRA